MAPEEPREERRQEGSRFAWTAFHVSGIAVRVHLSLLLFLPFLAYLIAAQVPLLSALPLVQADADAVAAAFGGFGSVAAGIVVSVGLFASVLLHELGHALLAKRRGVPVPSITLWIFGGVSHIEPEGAPKPSTEALFAAAGPAVSFVLGGVLLVASFFAQPLEWLAFVAAYLGFLNVVLGAFNLLPAFPLDGGRLLRAGLASRMPYPKATKWAAAVGKLFAIAMGIVGLFYNIFLVFIAFFVYAAANAETQQVEVLSALSGIPVEMIMDRSPPTIGPEEHLDRVVDRMLGEGVTGFPVTEGNLVVGIVTLTDVRMIPAEQRPVTRVADVMKTELATTFADTPASDALDEMLKRRVGRLVVLEDGGVLAGVITREGLLRAFEISRATGVGEEYGPPRHA